MALLEKVSTREQTRGGNAARVSVAIEKSPRPSGRGRGLRGLPEIASASPGRALRFGLALLLWGPLLPGRGARGTPQVNRSSLSSSSIAVPTVSTVLVDRDNG